MALLKAVFECTVVTPMFLSGTNQESVELRAASLRGVMRYWYRAVLGAQGLLDLPTLKQRESAIFGNTDAGSPVSVRIVPVTFPSASIRNPENLKDWKGTDKHGTPTKYLWYSTRLGDNCRVYLEPGTTFHIVFTAIAKGDSERTSKARIAFAETIKAFWLVVHLGSLGTRARRAAGSFDAQLIDLRADDVQLPTFATLLGNGYDAYLRDGLRSIVQPAQTLPGRPAFSVLHPAHARVWRSGRTARSWEDAVWNFGGAFREFRLRRGVDQEDATRAGLDYHTMKAVLAGGAAPPTVERASFGLPLTFRFSGIKGSTTVQPARSNRRASPLWVRIVRLGETRYDAVLTFFDSQFLPPGEQMKVSKAYGTASPPSSSLVPVFVEDKFPNAVSLL